MSTSDTERYVRVTLLTFEGGLWITRKILTREVTKSGSLSIDTLLHGKKTVLKNRRDITEIQLETLFPTSGNATDIEEWDLSLLIKVIKILFGPGLSGQDVYLLDELLRIRNEVVCHARQSSMSEQDFYKHWAQLSMCVGSLASHFDVQTTQDASELTERLSRGPLDLRSSIERIAQLCRIDEHMITLLESSTKQEQMLSEATTKLDDVLTEVRDLAKRQTEKEENQCRVAIPILDTTVFISGEDYTAVKSAADVVYKNFKSVVDKEETPKNKGMDRCAVEQFTADIESKGATVESVEKGSIILRIRCNDLDGLDNVLSLFRDNGSRFRLPGIEKALNSIMHAVVKVEFVLQDKTVEMLRKWIGGKTQVYKKQFNLGIKCDSTEAAVDVIKYLHSGTAANRLNQIADSVSEVAGNRIKIDAASDVKGFSQAFVISNTEFKGLTEEVSESKRQALDRSVTRRQGMFRDEDFKAIAERFTSFDEVKNAIKKIVDTDIGLIFGMDYSMSNRRTQEQMTFDDINLHQISVTAIHPYQEVICFLGETLEQFDDNGIINTFGFGYVEKDKGIFPWMKEVECQGFLDVLDAYDEMTPDIELGGPANFAPLIQEAVEIVEQKKQFHILVIVTDNQVTCENETIEAIVQASHYPLSIVVIWVGDGPCDVMDKFVEHVPERLFDNFQFVDFHHIKAVAKNPEAAVALAVLMKLPAQYRAICTHELLR